MIGQVDRWLADVMSHFTQLERVKLGVTRHQFFLRPYQDAALQKDYQRTDSIVSPIKCEIKVTLCICLVEKIRE